MNSSVWTVAKEELLRAVRSAGVKYGEKSVDFLEQVLSKTRDLDRTIRMLTPERLDPEFTRYDTIRTNPTSAGIRIKNLPLKKNSRKCCSRNPRPCCPFRRYR